MKTNNGTGAQRLAAWIDRHKLTHAQFLSRLHAAGLPALNLPTIGRWLSATRTPRIGAIMAIWRVTKIHPSAWSAPMTDMVPRQLARRKVNMGTRNGRAAAGRVVP